MKPLTYGLATIFSTLFLSVWATSGRAQVINPTTNAPQFSDSVMVSLTPYEVATLAYQGAFVNQGIPGYAQLLMEHYLGRIDAREIAESAVAKNLISPQTLNDPGFLNAIDNQLRNLETHR